VNVYFVYTYAYKLAVLRIVSGDRIAIRGLLSKDVKAKNVSNMELYKHSLQARSNEILEITNPKC